MELLISLLSGALGGTSTGSALRALNLGFFGNALVGVIGGGLGSHTLALALGGGLEVSGIIGQVASGGIGGMLAVALVGMIGKRFTK